MKLWLVRHAISVLSESKKDKNFFDYKDLSSDMWHKKIKEAQDKHTARTALGFPMASASQP